MASHWFRENRRFAMTLEEAAQQLSADLKFQLAPFLSFCAEDSVGGYLGKGNWPRTSIREVEGKLLYAMVKSSKPQTVIEFGSGCSTSHIASALEANRFGRLITVDPDQSKRRDKSPFVTEIASDGLDWSAQMDFPINLVFHDGPHTEHFTHHVLHNCLANLSPGGIVIVHDVFLPSCGHKVTSGMRLALGDGFNRIAIEPSNCGLGYWKKSP